MYQITVSSADLLFAVKVGFCRHDTDYLYMLLADCQSARFTGTVNWYLGLAKKKHMHPLSA